ncbi:ankyrin repeat-containing protein [Thelonectria olida]|uniref:Ankyrin repeat-containing protein n=1 Tax=Thelonectria olida TaxID=1576542 RepID=A0A9P8WAH9_9HYPO|nr:ankyrin repeat-containing protein [Thelonectria olida]
MSHQQNRDTTPLTKAVIEVQEKEDKVVTPEKRDQPETSQEKEKGPFTWLEPHPTFVIILVGSEEQPFGIQKDFLCDRSDFFRKHFEDAKREDKVEHIVKLPETTKEVFGLVQNYLYTETVISDVANVPAYEALIGLWNLGHKLGIRGLCDKSLNAMVECRKITQRIPATPLLIQVWRDTPEGSTIRKLLLSWTAEYMRSSDARAEFAKSLPQEVLSELVVAMSSIEAAAPAPVPEQIAPSVATPHKNVHYLDEAEEDESLLNRKARRTVSGGPPLPAEQRLKVKTPRLSFPKPTPKRRSSTGVVDSRLFTTAQKLDFCADLLTRMLSGPGFWTRLVGPFREPVEPVEDGVPDYLDKIKRPMDLSTMKAKMDRKEYATDDEFLADMRQIFDNCFTYWSKGDPIWNAGEKLQKTFEDKYGTMNKWISKMGGEEAD